MDRTNNYLISLSSFVRYMSSIYNSMAVSLSAISSSRMFFSGFAFASHHLAHHFALKLDAFLYGSYMRPSRGGYGRIVVAADRLRIVVEGVVFG